MLRIAFNFINVDIEDSGLETFNQQDYKLAEMQIKDLQKEIQVRYFVIHFYVLKNLWKK